MLSNMCGKTVVVTLALFCVLLSTISAETVTVSLPGGQIMGTSTQSSVTSSRTYWSFFGVRYAEPPTGENRFLAPKELQPWSGVYDATLEKGICYAGYGESPLETEDCLMLNIFSPREKSIPALEKISMINKDSKHNETTTSRTNIRRPLRISDPLDPSTDYLPVMVHIHGGGFIHGSGTVASGFGPDFFMDYDVVVVSINYRLGAFGFLSTGDSVIPGNAGLKDQLLALKWVQQNIKYFGGDPSKVTIFGQSAGAASVSYHILSPKSAGLFHAAIMESGSALSPWAYQRNAKKYSLLTAEFVDPAYNSTGVTSAQLLTFLQSADVKAIDLAQSLLQILYSPDDNQLLQGFYYAPVIEPASDDAFITQEMYELFENGHYNKVPVIIGTNTDEGLLVLNPATASVLDSYDHTPAYTVPHDMSAAEANRTIAGQSIKAQYAPSSTWANNVTAGINYYTDTSFARSLIKQAELQSKYNDVYFYIFSYHGKMGMNTVELVGTNNVTHSEELPYLFTRGTNADLSQYPATDVNVHYRFMRFWTNFAKYQKPVVETDDLIQVDWPKVSSSNFEYMEIGANLVASRGPKWTIYQFWTNLYNTYGVPPYDTY